jgi:hypothetical protein
MCLKNGGFCEHGSPERCRDYTIAEECEVGSCRMEVGSFAMMGLESTKKLLEWGVMSFEFDKKGNQVVSCI